MGVGFLAAALLALVFMGTNAAFAGRIIYNTGLALLVILLLIIGILDVQPNYENRPALAWTQSSLMLVWNFCYDFSVLARYASSLSARCLLRRCEAKPSQ